MKLKVLFILKEREQSGGGPLDSTGTWSSRTSTGLRNSVRYVAAMLRHIGIEAHYVTVVDNNSIDREVTLYNPTHVIIEALWVVPSKFAVLKSLHPTVKWNVRLHSEVPFLSQEGIAFEWIYGYLAAGVSVSANSLRMRGDLQTLTGKPIPYAPNFYPLYPLEVNGTTPTPGVINIGCFGAIRPLKNQLAQAVAAIDFANLFVGTSLHFHINGNRVEGGGSPILRNLEALFAANPQHQLIQHEWLGVADFIALVQTMDLGMQVSFSETFNIVSADMVTANVPLVGSSEVTWLGANYQADPTNIGDMARKLTYAWQGRTTDVQRVNYTGLSAYDTASEVAWPIALAEM